MRKMTMISLAAAAILLLSGCEQKGSNSNEHQAQAQKTTQQEVPKAAPSVAQESSKAAPETQVEEKQAQEAASVQTEEEAAPATKTEEKTNSLAQPQESLQQATESAQAAVDGAALYAKCASCHGPKGEKKALGKSGIIAGMAKEEVLKKLQGYQAGTLSQYGMGPLMKGQVAGLNEAQLEALADYISKLK